MSNLNLKPGEKMLHDVRRALGLSPKHLPAVAPSLQSFADKALPKAKLVRGKRSNLSRKQFKSYQKWD